MTERNGILPGWVSSPEFRWAAGGLLAVLVFLTWWNASGTGLSIRRLKEEIAVQQRHLSGLEQEQARKGSEPDQERADPPAVREESLSRILAGLASAPGGATAAILEVNASPTIAGSTPATIRIRLTGHPGRAAAFLRELEQGPADLLVTAVTVQLPPTPYGSTIWIVSGVLP